MNTKLLFNKIVLSLYCIYGLHAAGSGVAGCSVDEHFHLVAKVRNYHELKCF